MQKLIDLKGVPSNVTFGKPRVNSRSTYDAGGCTSTMHGSTTKILNVIGVEIPYQVTVDVIV